MKIIMRIALAALLTAGFAAGFPFGRSGGDTTGSEWSLVRADIHAREAGQFRIILKQPEHLYGRAWMPADRHEDEMEDMSGGDRTLNERIHLIRYAALLQ